MSEQTGDRMIRVDMTQQTATIEPFPEAWKHLGGRGLSARILLEECDPGCDPLGPDNLLVMAPGVLSGTSAPTSGRISIGGKSPLTGGIKEANAGGNPGQDLMKLGYRVVVVSGQPADPDRRYALEIDADGATLVPADEHKGKWNYKLIEDLAKSYSEAASFISIGPAGEMRLTGASVACTDQEQERNPARHAGRGGLGAVMGSKGLKYVSVDPGKRPVRKPANKKEFGALCKKYTKYYLDGPAKEPFPKWGTSVGCVEADALYTFPYKNRVEGRSPDVHTLDGMRIVESFEERGGGMHNCMTGCIVKCSNVVHDKDGNYKTSALEFETLTLLGSTCGIASWEDVADLDRLCDEIGLDTIETGAAIAVYMDSGGMEFGDADGARRILREIAEGTELGRAIGNGAAAIGRKRKHHRVPVVKGQALPAWDPRPLKASGITYCTSAMGADHTAGLIVEPGQPQEEMAKASQRAQIVNAVVDSSGFCSFMMINLDEVRGFYSEYFGEEVTREQIADMGWQILQDEWEFNRRAGFDARHDAMPDCLKQDAIGPAKLVWDVPDDVVADAYERFENADELFTLRS
ncbi:MAG: aldehyde ferredoxin oxidoreductase [Deltaproteobacteria bacterium]|jgi:aldehyde:ferredoxin oxidoreductase|nr:aldehyde ferredoxin oxidoreductase [Deltaproteobacteria bacterium]MBW2540857.1 aldehyde ferredoxin oxidoreductase [Deltaproteobacteria bacterium]